MIALTRLQAKTLAYIRGYIEAHGFGPSFEEIRRDLRISSRGGVHRIMIMLEERGAIRRLKNQARAIEVVEPTLDALENMSAKELRGVISLCSDLLADMERERSSRARLAMIEK